MVENKEYSPTSAEWDELVLLWNRSKAIFANMISTGVQARLAWTTKNFVESRPDASHRAVYAWLERNLEIARGAAPTSERQSTTRPHDEITAVHRTPRRTPHGHVTTTEGDPADASDT
jgi:hypothetical protein